MKKKIPEKSFVFNTKNGKTYFVTTAATQSRGRRELVGTGIRNPEVTRAVETHLHPISLGAAAICSEAERIIRWKEKQSEFDKQILVMYRALKESIVK